MIIRENKWLSLFVALFYIMTFISGCGVSKLKKTENGRLRETEAYSVTDLTGAKVSFTGKPKRILTFSMYTDQIVLGLVTSDHMAAANQLLDDPQESNVLAISKRIPRKISNPTAEEVSFS